MRDSLNAVLTQLAVGQVLLASMAARRHHRLFGTVWGIFTTGDISRWGDRHRRVSGPVGEALVMTAAGLAVAIPAVLAYNIFGKLVTACETELEGFAHDLREMLSDHGGAGDVREVTSPRD